MRTYGLHPWQLDDIRESEWLEIFTDLRAEDAAAAQRASDAKRR